MASGNDTSAANAAAQIVARMEKGGNSGFLSYDIRSVDLIKTHHLV